MKPDPEIYLRTLSRLGRRPDEAVFIDDALGNIEAAREVGMAVIHFNPQTDVVAELATLHVIVGGPQ